MSNTQVIKQLEQYARKRHVFIQDYKGITLDSLRDAKSLIKEFRSMAVQSRDAVVCDLVGSPDTGIMLFLFWCTNNRMTYRQLQGYVDDVVKEAHLIVDYEEEFHNDLIDL